MDEKEEDYWSMERDWIQTQRAKSLTDKEVKDHFL